MHYSRLVKRWSGAARGVTGVFGTNKGDAATRSCTRRKFPDCSAESAPREVSRFNLLGSERNYLTEICFVFVLFVFSRVLEGGPVHGEINGRWGGRLLFILVGG